MNRQAVLPPPLDGRMVVTLAESRAFGDGHHDTTALCLQAISALAPRGRAWSMLDFGSGTGLLSIVAAKLGGVCHGVEIDEAALANAADNARLNDVTLTFARGLPTNTKYEFVVANILRGILVSFEEPLTRCLADGASLVLSGLTSTDIPEVSAVYARRLGARPEVYARGEWRALVWRSAHRHEDASGAGA